MPELAEVEYYRRQWNDGIGARIVAMQLHATKRIFRGTDTHALKRELIGKTLAESLARGKRMLFRFSGDKSLGIHLGMTGTLRIESGDFRPEKHDHLVLFQRDRALVFRDPRQFGRVHFHSGKDQPHWWRSDLREIGDREFNRRHLDDFLARHGRAPIKAVLLLQNGFPGIGNWMADEILWRARIHPSKRTARLTSSQRTALLRETKFVARESLRIIGRNDSDLPRSWLIHRRWKAGGVCPRDDTKLKRATIGGRTTAWCPKCQRN